jgi:glycerate kinase
MHVLIAPNAFKHALSAEDAAIAINEGLKRSELKCTTELFPVGDGGDGTGWLISKKLNGASIQRIVSDPLGKKTNASFYYIKKTNTAIIELAEASGLKLLKKEEYNPLVATTFGTGELISYALDVGARQILLCIGGSATVDGGAGLLRALGIRFIDRDRNELQVLPIDFEKLQTIDISNLDKRIQNCKLMILCDVDNPLLGRDGAAFVFGPQKGATPEIAQQLEACLSHFASVVNDQFAINITKIKHGGAAGGTAAGAFALLNAQLVEGIDYFLSITDFDDTIKNSNLILTGEGSVDIQTLHGKGPAGIAKRAKRSGIPVIAFAGKMQAGLEDQYKELFEQLIVISDKETSLENALLKTGDNLAKAAKELGDQLAQH